MVTEDGLWLSVRPQRHPPSAEVSVEFSLTTGGELPHARVRRNGSLLRADGDGGWTLLAVVRLTHVWPRSWPMPFPDGERVTVGVERLTPPAAWM